MAATHFTPSLIHSFIHAHKYVALFSSFIRRRRRIVGETMDMHTHSPFSFCAFVSVPANDRHDGNENRHAILILSDAERDNGVSDFYLFAAENKIDTYEIWVGQEKGTTQQKSTIKYDSPPMTTNHRHRTDCDVGYNHCCCCCCTIGIADWAAFVDENSVEVLDNYFGDKAVDCSCLAADDNYYSCCSDNDPE